MLLFGHSRLNLRVLFEQTVHLVLLSLHQVDGSFEDAALAVLHIVWHEVRKLVRAALDETSQFLDLVVDVVATTTFHLVVTVLSPTVLGLSLCRDNWHWWTG